MTPYGYDWTNVGGTAVQLLAINTHTPIQRAARLERGQHLATLEFDPVSNTGTLVKVTDFSGNASGGNLGTGPSIDGPGSSGPVNGSTAPGNTSGGNNGDYGDYDDVTGGTGTPPTIPSASEGFEFRVNTEETTKSVKVTIRDVVGDWALFESGTVIAGNNYTVTGVTKEVNSWSTAITITNLKNTLKSYKLVANGSSVAIEETNNDWVTGQRQYEILKYVDTILSYKFNAGTGDIVVPHDLPSFITDTSGMFAGCTTFNQDIGHWDMSRVTDIGSMFSNCLAFNQDLSSWDVSNVTSMYYTFADTLSFNQNLSTWNTSKVTSMYGMFIRAAVFNGVVSNFDTSLVTDMSYMFYGCAVFNQPIGNWSTASLTNVSNMFNGAAAFNQDLSDWNVSGLTSLHELFKEAAAFNGDISAWDVSNVTTMHSTFHGALAFNSDISDWDTSNVTDMASLFRDTNNFNANIAGWNVSSVSEMDYMFTRAAGFNRDLSSWCVASMSSPYDFSYSAVSWGYPKPIWGTCPRGENTGGAILPLPEPIPGFEFSTRTLNGRKTDLYVLLTGVTGDWAIMSGSHVIYNQATSNRWVVKDPVAKTVRIRIQSDTNAQTLNVTGTPTGMTMSCEYNNSGSVTHQTQVNVHRFSPSISRYSFSLENTRLIIEPTLPSNVTTMRDMFKGTTLYNQDISSWNVANVTDMRGAFDGCSNFNCDLSNWDVSNVTDMVNVFAGCVKFNQDLSSWNVTNIKRKPIGFAASAKGWVLPKPIWGTNGGVGVVVPEVQGGETSEYVIRVTNKDTLLTQPLEVLIQIYQPGSDWSIKDLDTGTVIASNTVTTSTDPRVTYTKNGTFLTFSLFSPVADTRRYGITSSGSQCLTRCQPTIGSDVPAHGMIEIESFSNLIAMYKFTVTNMDLLMPNYLPTNITSFEEMFRYAPKFNQDLTTWNTVNVTNMQNTFINCIDFDGDLSAWDVSNVTTMKSMFQACRRFNQDLTNWDVSSVTDFESMFSNCIAFDADIADWKTTSAIKMDSMFAGCTKFNQDLSQWVVDTVTSTSRMFSGAKLFSQDLGSWNTSNIKEMRYMFADVKMETQDLSTWCVTNVKTKPSSFVNYTAQTLHNSPVWGTCPIKGMGFSIQSDDTTQSDVPFILSAVNVRADWTLKCDGQLIASATYMHPGVTVTGDVDIKITLTGLRNKTLDYVLRANADCVTLGDSTYETYVGVRTITVKSFYNQIRQYKFAVGDDLLTVPTGLAITTSSLRDMFAGCVNFNQDISTWNTSTIGDMSGMFRGCTTFNRNLTAWDVRQVTDMSGMFWGCTTFNQNLSVWKPDLVTNMQNMFRDCYSYNRPMDKWDVSLVTNLSYMFYGCRMFDQPLNTWTIHRVTDVSYMFSGCTVFNKPLEDWNTTNVTNMAHMFNGCIAFNQDLNLWDVEKVTNFDYMFNNCSKYNKALTLWCVRLVTSTPTGFATGANSWSTSKPIWGTCPISGLVFSTVSSAPDSEISISISFEAGAPAWSLVDLITGRVIADQSGAIIEDSGISVSSDGIQLQRGGRNTARYLLKGKLNTTRLVVDGRFNGADDFITVEQFSHHIHMHQFDFGSIKHPQLPATLPRHITTMQRMFYNWEAFNQDISGWDTSNITNMSETFYLTAFNQDISGWNVSNVTDLSGIFESNAVFNQDLSGWDTSKVSDMHRAFIAATAFNGDVSTWKTSKVTDMSYMFYGAVAFNQPIGGWDVSNVTSMYNMFAGCTTFNQDLSAWNTHHVTNFEWMFYNTAVFNQDLSQWCVPTLNNTPSYFDSTTPAWVLPKPVWGTCPRLEIQPPKPVVPQPTAPATPAEPEVIVSDVYKFSTQNLLDPEMRLPISISWGESYRPFTLKENGVIIADYATGMYAEGVVSQSYYITIATRSGGTNNYELTTTNASVAIEYDQTGTDMLAVQGKIVVEAFSSTVRGFKYRLPCIQLTVPEGLPSTVTSMDSMFTGCSLFNQNINAWNITNVTTLYSTFMQCISYNQPVSAWNTINVVNMDRTFFKCTTFNQHLNNWNTANVTGMSGTFQKAAVFDAKLDKWVTDKVTGMDDMFSEATFFNQDISMWDTAALTSAMRMFYRAFYFNQDLSLWCVSGMDNDYRYSQFSDQTVAWVLPKPVWGTCPVRP